MNNRDRVNRSFPGSNIRAFTREIRHNYPSQYQNYLNAFIGLLVYDYLIFTGRIKYTELETIEEIHQLNDVYLEFSLYKEYSDVFKSFYNNLKILDESTFPILKDFINILKQSKIRNPNEYQLIYNSINNSQPMRRDSMSKSFADDFIFNLVKERNTNINNILLIGYSNIRKLQLLSRDTNINIDILESSLDQRINIQIQAILLDININNIHFIEEIHPNKYDYIFQHIHYNDTVEQSQVINGITKQGSLFILADLYFSKTSSLNDLLRTNNHLERVIYLFDNLNILELNESNDQIELIDLSKMNKRDIHSRYFYEQIKDLLDKNEHLVKTISPQQLEENEYNMNRDLYFVDMNQTNTKSIRQLEDEYDDLRRENDMKTRRLLRDLDSL